MLDSTFSALEWRKWKLTWIVESETICYYSDGTYVAASTLERWPSSTMSLSACWTVVLSSIWILCEAALMIFRGTTTADIESNILSVGIFPWNVRSKASSSQSLFNGSLIFRMLSMQLHTEVHLCVCAILYILFNHLLWLVQHWMVVSTFELHDQTRRATLLPPRIWTGDLHEFHCREKKFQLRVVTLPSFFAVCAHICFNNKKIPLISLHFLLMSLVRLRLFCASVDRSVIFWMRLAMSGFWKASVKAWLITLSKE